MVRVRRAAMHRLLYLAFLVLAVVGTSREARARTAVVATRLDYLAAPGCPGVARFEAVVIGRLGYDPFRADTRIGSPSTSIRPARRSRVGSSGATRARRSSESKPFHPHRRL